jgi:hypothetical protein
MNSGAAIAGNASISNLTLGGDATVSATGGRFDIGTGAANMLLQGNGNTLTKIGSQEINLRPQYISNLAAVVIQAGTIKYENYDRTNAATVATTNYVGTSATLASYLIPA